MIFSCCLQPKPKFEIWCRAHHWRSSEIYIVTCFNLHQNTHRYVGNPVIKLLEAPRYERTLERGEIDSGSERKNGTVRRRQNRGKNDTCAQRHSQSKQLSTMFAFNKPIYAVSGSEKHLFSLYFTFYLNRTDSLCLQPPSLALKQASISANSLTSELKTSS